MIPAADPVFISVLLDLAGPYGKRVGLDIQTPLPSLRVVTVRDYDAPSAWERTPLAQVEVWANTKAEAGELAATVSHLWRTVRKGFHGGAFVSRAWVDSEPIHFPDNTTDKARYLMVLGLRIHSPD